MSADGSAGNEHPDRHPAAADAPESDNPAAQDPDRQVPDRAEEDHEARTQQNTQATTPARAAASGAVLPNKAAEDDPRRWGDQPGNYDHDAWLQEQKPPHWG